MKNLVPVAIRALLPLVALLAGCSGGAPTPIPAIASFSAVPATVFPGNPSVLSWSVTGADSITIDNGVGDVTALTQKQVTPAATTVYTLTAKNAGGSATAVTTVTVQAQAAIPLITSFAANPSTISAGGSSTLSWSVTGADSLSIDQGIGSVTGTSRSVSPTATTAYTLTASNTAGTATATTTVTVTAAGSVPTISAFSANPASIASGGSSTLSWTVSGATSLAIDQGVGPVTGTSKSVSPTVTTTYTLTATNATGSATATTTVTVTAGTLGLSYTDPAAGGKVRLLRSSLSSATHLILDVTVGSSGLTGFGVALNLPVNASVTFDSGTGLIFNTALLNPGSAGTPTARGMIPTTGPLANVLSIGVARKKTLASDGDVSLPAGATLFSIALDLAAGATAGTVFNGGSLPAAFKAAVITVAGAQTAATSDFKVGTLTVN